MPPPPKRSLGIVAPIGPPYDALWCAKQPLPDKARRVCQAWAAQGYGTPLLLYVVYLLKIGLYVGGWLWACSASPTLGGPGAIADWWLAPLAFQKAIVWSLLFEGLGLGCGSGPLTGRYWPPFGGALYWLRPGTTKLAIFPRVPVLGGIRRSLFDVLVYAALVGVAIHALASPTIAREQCAALVGLALLMGLLDKTIFLACRAEHYVVTLIVFVVAPRPEGWIAGAMAVQLALWFFAGVSKLNHHFGGVVCVMTSNAPLTRGTPLRRWVYRDAPNDLRPSRLAHWMGHGGTALELGIPVVLLLAPMLDVPWLLPLGVGMALWLHTFITSNVPMGVPLEWNVMVVYGVFALFVAHPQISVLDLDAGSTLATGGLAALLLTTLVVVPIAGNVWPHRVSFLLAMRYYAGNWPYSIWLFRGDAYRKLEKLTKPAAWVHDQLARFYDRELSVGLVGKVMSFRMMHLQGRLLGELLPKLVEDQGEVRDYEYVDGELVAGLALGWNFGDGHLHHERLLDAIQQQCGFEPGELRCLFVEGQPLGGRHIAWRMADAAEGPIAEGATEVTALRERQPWGATAPSSGTGTGTGTGTG